MEASSRSSRKSWRQTIFPNRSEALAQISEYSEAGITVRGNNNSVKYVFIIIMYIISGIYYAPGKGVPGGERKLYLAIERGRQHGLIGEKVPWSRVFQLYLRPVAHKSTVMFF
jgi:hypothetical protein